jgi:hypothetical protein
VTTQSLEQLQLAGRCEQAVTPGEGARPTAPTREAFRPASAPRGPRGRPDASPTVMRRPSAAGLLLQAARAAGRRLLAAPVRQWAAAGGAEQARLMPRRVLGQRSPRPRRAASAHRALGGRPALTAPSEGGREPPSAARSPIRQRSAARVQGTRWGGRGSECPRTHAADPAAAHAPCLARRPLQTGTTTRARPAALQHACPLGPRPAPQRSDTRAPSDLAPGGRAGAAGLHTGAAQRLRHCAGLGPPLQPHHSLSPSDRSPKRPTRAQSAAQTPSPVHGAAASPYPSPQGGRQPPGWHAMPACPRRKPGAGGCSIGRQLRSVTLYAQALAGAGAATACGACLWGSPTGHFARWRLRLRFRRLILFFFHCKEATGQRP